jgi:hypothetical protein
MRGVAGRNIGMGTATPRAKMAQFIDRPTYTSQISALISHQSKSTVFKCLCKQVTQSGRILQSKVFQAYPRRTVNNGVHRPN